MLPNDLYHVFVRRNDKHHPAGRFVVHHGQLAHLEDYHNGLVENEIPSGVVDDVTLAKIAHPGGNLKIVSDADWRAGRHLDLVPQAKLEQTLPPAPPPTAALMQNPPRPPSIWHYRHDGHDAAHTLEHHGGGKYTLDGNSLNDDELHTILGNVSRKAASLRYKHSGVVDAVTKMEQVFSSLRKEEDEMDPDSALAHLDKVHGDNPETMKAIKSLRRRVFEDPMTPTGNKFAWEQFRKKNTPGAYVSMDANNFRDINNLYGHSTGDDAIRAMGQAVRGASDEVGEGKTFRSGGDEFTAHFPTYEHAARFARSLRNNLEQVTPIEGTHKLGMSVGIGHDYDTADRALYEAKKQKTAPTGQPYAPHEAPALMAHSLHPGFEGPVPLQAEQLPALALPEGAKSQPAPTPSLDTPATATKTA